MFPTPTDQLSAARRLLDASQDLEPGSDAAVELASGARSLLRRLEGQLDRRMPFLLDDSARASRLLADLRSQLPGLSQEIDAVAARPRPQSELDAHQTNLLWQGLLASAIHELPENPEGLAARARIADHVSERLASNPALHRDPADRPQ